MWRMLFLFVRESYNLYWQLKDITKCMHTKIEENIHMGDTVRKKAELHKCRENLFLRKHTEES